MEYIALIFSGVAAAAAVAGLIFLWKQTAHLRLPSFRALSTEERDLLKAMRETSVYFVASFDTAELVPFIVNEARADEHRLVIPAGLVVSGHYYQPCQQLVERGLIRKPESRANANVEYELTPKGGRVLKKYGKQLDKHSHEHRFRDKVAYENERRRRPNTVDGSVYEYIGGEPLGNTPDTHWIATIVEYPTLSRQPDRICDVLLPLRVDHVKVGDLLYIKLDTEPLFLPKRNLFAVTVTNIVDHDSYKILICGEDKSAFYISDE